MIEPKEIIYSKVSELITSFPSLEVAQDRPEVIEHFPMITFRISSNNPEYDLDKVVENQKITTIIDIWANTSIESGQLLVALERKMAEIDYLLSFSSDVTDPDGYSHVTTQFIF